MNVLYVDDLIVWVQQVGEEVFLDFGRKVEGVLGKLEKKDIGFELEEMEEEAMELGQEFDEEAEAIRNETKKEIIES